ncbi:DUF4865 family protein [Streptomyces sp. CBMA152]|uniref:DUF4865 family protein n=1 Tax=Streptomyces sp. CBMA152 TaxID=1896312 RepID=UPI00166103ED|nr:DUF4865 family protein [Streptomyces sp. CBMA152]MBD0743797.1 DUF4865 domain-containing protein [Streptomyces sp. CBMA152]
MHAMQYEIVLPADYDMDTIRTRVAARGHVLDDFPGLGLKAYLMRERGTDSPVNSYAPFYLWNTPEGMNSFLWNPLFQGLVDTFGRPEVRYWTVLSYEENAPGTLPASATRLRVPVPDGIPPADFVAESLDRTPAEGAVASAVVIDPSRWELVHFTLWEGKAPQGPGDRFEVLHLSAPERDKMAAGRQW